MRDNPDSLQKLLDLFQKSGDTSHVSEVMELLAHASVQSGDLPRSRDLYQQLAQIEPQNALHMQNYQQVLGQLGGTSGTKLISPEEAIVLLDDLETTAPALHQHYSDEVSLAVRAALTDAELFISYNMPAKALGPLVGVLPIAPTMFVPVAACHFLDMLSPVWEPQLLIKAPRAKTLRLILVKSVSCNHDLAALSTTLL